MCMPCGPRGKGYPGRRRFRTIDSVMHISLEKAQEKYPDHSAAMNHLLEITEKNIDHTMNWLIDCLAFQDPELLRIVAEEKNFSTWKKVYNKLKSRKIA